METQKKELDSLTKKVNTILKKNLVDKIYKSVLNNSEVIIQAKTDTLDNMYIHLFLVCKKNKFTKEIAKEIAKEINNLSSTVCKFEIYKEDIFYFLHFDNILN